MDERNKDLPLIVSEILIEMHEMKEDIREMKDALNRVATVVLKQQEHTNSMFNTIREESQKNMEYITSVLVDFRRENQQLAADIRQEAQEDRRFSTYSLNKAMGQQQQVNAAFEQRLTELEAKYNG